jgi:hypothetical protein
MIEAITTKQLQKNRKGILQPLLLLLMMDSDNDDNNDSTK